MVVRKEDFARAEELHDKILEGEGDIADHISQLEDIIKGLKQAVKAPELLDNYNQLCQQADELGITHELSAAAALYHDVEIGEGDPAEKVGKLEGMIKALSGEIERVEGTKKVLGEILETEEAFNAGLTELRLCLDKIKNMYHGDEDVMQYVATLEKGLGEVIEFSSLLLAQLIPENRELKAEEGVTASLVEGKAIGFAEILENADFDKLLIFVRGSKEKNDALHKGLMEKTGKKYKKLVSFLASPFAIKGKGQVSTGMDLFLSNPFQRVVQYKNLMKELTKVSGVDKELLEDLDAPEPLLDDERRDLLISGLNEEQRTIYKALKEVKRKGIGV